MKNPEPDSLKDIAKILEKNYGIGVSGISLHREMIGFIYFIESDRGRLVFKLFRSLNTPEAEQAVEIMCFLQSKGYPVPPVIRASGKPFVEIGCRLGVLHEFIPGREPDADDKIAELGMAASLLHELMEGYPKPLIPRDREFYADRFIDMLCDSGYEASKITDLRNFAKQTWECLSVARKGFCHGDFHTGNMIETGDGVICLLDFDAAASGFPVIDAAVICDRTHFNKFNRDAFDTTRRAIGKFYSSYSKDGTPNKDEYRAIFSFIALRHYELIATIVKSKDGGKMPAKAFLDRQHEWLMKWWSLCASKGVI